MPSRPYYRNREIRESWTNAWAETSFGPLRRLVLVAVHFSQRRQPDAAFQHPPRDLSSRALLAMGSSAPAPIPETVVCFALSSSQRSNSCSLGRAVPSLLRPGTVAKSAMTGCSACRCVLSVGLYVSTDAID
jgi:hypothetical protein